MERSAVIDCNSEVGEESMVERIEYSRLMASDPKPWLRVVGAVLEVVFDPGDSDVNVAAAAAATAADVREENDDGEEDVEGTLGKLNSAWASFRGGSKKERKKERKKRKKERESKQNEFEEIMRNRG
jgi:hypothetical protein